MIDTMLILEFCGYLTFHLFTTYPIYFLDGPMGSPKRRKKSYKDSYLTLTQFMMTAGVFVIYKNLLVKSLVFMTFKPFLAYTIAFIPSMMFRERMELIYQLIVKTKQQTK